jgi:hypothetical protein
MQNHQKRTEISLKWLWLIPFCCNADKSLSSVFVLAYILPAFDWNFTDATQTSQCISYVVLYFSYLNIQFLNIGNIHMFFHKCL